MSSILYGRKFNIYIAQKDNTAWNVSNLKVRFNTSKAFGQTVNYSEIDIYNLTRDTENAIVKSGDRVIIEAGYQATEQIDDSNDARYIRYGKIFDGRIIQVMRDRQDNVDYILRLSCIDGDDFMNNSIIKYTLNSGIDQRTALENVASKASKPTELGRITPDLSTTKLPRGKVFFGAPKDYIRSIANGNGAYYWIEDNKLQVIKTTDEYKQADVIVITPENGMIGTPQQVELGVSVRCLLDPRIKLNSVVKIDNTMIRQTKMQIGQARTQLDENGTYRVVKISHVGDTRDNDWYTNIEGVGMNGKIPLQLTRGANYLR